MSTAILPCEPLLTASEKADLDVEDIATLHLDMLANDEGYD